MLNNAIFTPTGKNAMMTYKTKTLQAASMIIYYYLLFIDLSQHRYTTLILEWTTYMQTANRCDGERNRIPIDI